MSHIGRQAVSGRNVCYKPELVMRKHRDTRRNHQILLVQWFSKLLRSRCSGGVVANFVSYVEDEEKECSRALSVGSNMETANLPADKTN